MWKLYALLAAVFAALTAILSKIGVRGVSGNVATAIRTVVVVLLAWGIVVFGGQLREVRELGRVNLWMLCLSGVATGLSWIFYFKALETGDVSRVAPLDKLSVVFVMIIAFVFLGEPVTLKSVAGGLLIALGAIILAL
jgi:transporter family protein